MSGYQRTYQSSYTSQRFASDSIQKELNVPGYETRVRYKNDLGKRQNQELDIACFLMAVEVERLVRENTQLKQEIQNFIDSGLDRVNYEMQIRDLMEKLKNQTFEVNSYSEERERLVIIIRELEDEIRRLEEQLKDYDPNWRKSQRDLELQLQLQNKLFGGKAPEEISKELEELRKKAKILDDLQKKIGAKGPDELLKELENLKKKAQQFDDINKKLNGKNFSDLEKELEKLRQKADKFDEISKQFSNPSDIQKELDQLKKKAAELDKLKTQLNNQNPDQLLKSLDENKKQLQSKDREIGDLKRLLSELQQNQGSYDDQIRLLQQKIDELEEKVVGLAQELSRYKMLLKAKDDELNKLQLLFRDSETRLAQMNNELQRSKNDLQRAQGDLQRAQGDLQKAQGDLRKAQTDLSRSQQENQNLKQQSDDLRRQNQELAQENNNLQQDLENQTQNLGQLDEIKDQLNELQDEKNQLNDKVSDLQNNLKEKQRLFDQKQKELEDALKRVKDLEAKLLEMDHYIDTLEDDLQKFEKDNQQLNREAGQKQLADRELERLRGLLDQMKNQYDQQQKELGKLKNNLDQMRDLQDELAQAKSELDRANSVIAQQQDELAQKENEISQLVREVQNLEESNNQLQDQNNNLQQTLQEQQAVTNGNQEELTKLRRIAEDYKEKIRQLELKFNEYSNMEERLKQSDHRIAVLMTEIERLNSLVKQITSETEDWKQKHSRIELALLEYRQIEKTNRDAVNKNQQFINEIERLKKLLEAKHIELLQTIERCELLESQQQTLMNQVQDALKKADTGDEILLQYLLIAAENERLSGILQPMQEKFNQLTTQVKEMTVKYTELQNKTLGIDLDEYERLKKLIIEYENKIAMLSLEIQRLKAKTNILDKNGQSGNFGSNNNINIQYNSSMFQSNEDLSNKITDLLCLVAMMSAELDVLRSNNEKQVQQQLVNQYRQNTEVTNIQTVQSVETTSGFSYQRISQNRKY
ncbi:unnamed protein product (macronuclear) [Paramecium tetraurelia]|uniref:Uncharacterized protein n=1 Tax=Paramecium tetraurelia TaxID=5888 RepID=A0CJD5_PARTE|nr:uncharacterized protein GSPATT00000613001 [Paramecium tetraurelia]CAK70902.1 unnamed protein product [Paramecium tetraurelia]|eukprot:XP_001438299.1 hypothetical protein (macronuclear) [Paramecium tetraurelia strain d4-2]